MFERCARGVLAFAFVFALAFSLRAETSEIKVNLKLDNDDFVSGENIRGVVDIANPSPDSLSVGAADSKDAFFIEVFRSGSLNQMSKVSKHPFVSKFRLKSGEGQKLEVLIGEHYGLKEPNRYLAKPVLVHNGVRYEGTMRAFDVVDGVRLGGAMQMFKGHDDLHREFELVYWSRRDSEHLFLKAKDSGPSARTWETRDLGAMLRLDKPTISIMPRGEVVVLHRLNQDQFVRTEFWSLPGALEFRMREAVGDPETAGTARVRELYKQGGIKPKENPWWKFW